MRRLGNIAIRVEANSEIGLGHCLRIENGIWASKYPDFMLAKK